MGKTKQHSCQKRQKQKKMPPIDRLSTLPDEVICHILSFLPTVLSVSTSVLSKRWRSIWAHVPTLDFENEEIRPKVITRVISRHKVQNLNTFRLHYDDSDCNIHQLSTWMRAACERNVKNLDFLLDRSTFHTNLHGFNFESVINMTLDCVVGSIPTSLPNLKKLHLRCDYVIDDEDFPRLLSACPVLEELIMEKPAGGGLCRCKIISPTLKMLTFDFPFDSEVVRSFYDYRLEINAPALRYLKIRDCESNCISAQMFPSLIVADISLDYYAEFVEDDNYFVCVMKFVDCLFNVKSLRLSSGKTFSAGLFGKSTVRFDNLTKLELSIDWIFVKKFLEVADNLEVLIIHEVDDHLKNWMEPEQVPTCVSSHLRTVLFGFGGYCTKPEFDMAAYFLRNAKVLEQDVIDILSAYGSLAESLSRADTELEINERRTSEVRKLATHRSMSDAQAKCGSAHGSGSVQCLGRTVHTSRNIRRFHTANVMLSAIRARALVKKSSIRDQDLP